MNELLEYFAVAVGAFLFICVAFASLCLRQRSFSEEDIMGYGVEYYDLALGWTRVALEWSPATAMAMIAYLRQDDPSIAMRVVRVKK